MRIPTGERIGGHYDGLAKVKQYALHWQSGISFGSEEFTLGASETLRWYGYKVLGGDNLLFEGSDAAKATYQLGATVIGLRYNTFGPLAGNYNEAVIYVDWQLYDALERQVVFEHSTKGFARMSPRAKPAVFAAFNNAVRNLLAVTAFADRLRIDRPTATSVTKLGRLDIEVLVPPSPLHLPDHFVDVMQAVVTMRVGSTLASGFLVSPDGYVITAAHVVSGVEEVQLVFNSGLTLTASVLRRDDSQDVAILKLPGSGHRCLPLALETEPQPGADIYAVGTPFSQELAWTVTRGVVSGHREFQETVYLQTDASLNPGNSGGPLLNQRGEVVAVVSWKIVAPGFEGLAFGVPISAVERSLNVSFQSVERDTNP